MAISRFGLCPVARTKRFMGRVGWPAQLLEIAGGRLDARTAVALVAFPSMKGRRQQLTSAAAAARVEPG